MTFDDLLRKKRYGGELQKEEIDFFIDRLTADALPDYKVSAFLMAVCLQGMTDRETADLTEAMANSGNTLDLSLFGDQTVDKHSTGGVGDKTTLIVAPIAACAGCKIAKMSGRGLGDTGGTIDKLEAIPGFSVEPAKDEFLRQVEDVGIAVFQVLQYGAFAVLLGAVVKAHDVVRKYFATSFGQVIRMEIQGAIRPQWHEACQKKQQGQ